MHVSSNDILARAELSAHAAAETIMAANEGEPIGRVDELRLAEAKLAQALAAVRVAAFGISRKNPSFDAEEWTLLVEQEVEAIRGAHSDCPPIGHAERPEPLADAPRTAPKIETKVVKYPSSRKFQKEAERMARDGWRVVSSNGRFVGAARGACVVTYERTAQPQSA